MKKTSKKVIAVTLSASMLLGGSMTAMAATTNPDISQREIDHKTAAKNIAAQGMVLMENKNNSLPISAKKGTKVALFGQGVYNTIKGGTGSGAVNQRDNVTVQQGFENAGYDIVNADFVNQMHELWTANGGGTSQGWGFKWVNEPVYEQTEGAADQIKAAADQTDTAIYVIARNSGEGSDRSSGKGDYLLSDDERANLELLGKTFDNVVVVLNVGGIIDTKFFSEINGLDSMLLMSQAGMTGGDALVEVLNGTVNPSGKLTDTWPVNFDDNPSSAGFANEDGNNAQELYNDDIFVGYRYYDTSKVRVQYPFGFGLSYTEFTYSDLIIEEDGIKVSVTNTGDRDGAEVVQMYVGLPNAIVFRPEKELKGFEKVQLAPGETKTVTMKLDKRSFAWYNTQLQDWYAASGKYEILIGASSRDIRLSETIELSSSQVIPMHIHMNTTLGELFNNPDTKEAAKELTSRYLAAMNGGSDTASQSAAEAITEEMVAAMTDSMPLRSLCSFGGFSRTEIQEMIDKLQAIYSNPLK